MTIKYLLKVEGAAPVLYRAKTVAHRDGCKKAGVGKVYVVARVLEGENGLTVLSEQRFTARN